MKKDYNKWIIMIVGAGVMIILFLTLSCNAQSYRVSVCQDARLAVTNDILGNPPPILDVVTKLDADWKLLNANFNYEYAGLDTPFQRISLGGGIHYRWKFIEARQSLNYGVIVREFSTTWSAGSDSRLAFIYKRFRLITMIQVTQRTEWGDMIRWSGFVGVGYTIKE